MIKQLIGTLALLASLAVFVCTALHRDRYSSLLFDRERAEVGEQTPAGEPVEPAETPAVEEPATPAEKPDAEPATAAEEPAPATGEEASDVGQSASAAE